MLRKPSAPLAGTTDPHDHRGGKGSGFRFSPNPPKADRKRNVMAWDMTKAHSLLVQQEPDRLHCWALIVALVSSITGMTLLITAALL